MTREVGKYTEYHHYRHRDARKQSVYAVSEVCSVRYGSDNKYCHKDIEYPRRSLVAACEPAVVKLILLEEWDCGLRSLDILDHDDILLAYLWEGVLSDDNILREAHNRSYDNAETDLTDNLEFTLQTLFVVAEYLDVVIQKADGTAPYGRDNHQQYVDIVEARKEQ